MSKKSNFGSVAINPDVNGGEQVLFGTTECGIEICAMSHGSNSTTMNIMGVTPDDLIRVGQELKARQQSSQQE